MPVYKGAREVVTVPTLPLDFFPFTKTGPARPETRPSKRASILPNKHRKQRRALWKAALMSWSKIDLQVVEWRSTLGYRVIRILDDQTPPADPENPDVFYWSFGKS